MCGRFNVTSDPLTDLFMDLVGQKYPGEDNHNTAPMSKAWIIREKTEESNEHTEKLSTHPLEPAQAQWWLVPFWTKERSTKYSMFNARSENLRKSPAFREPYKRRRCIVPITGFYEWINRNGIRQPYYITDQAQEGLLLAGIWDRWFENQDSWLDSFAIITTQVVPTLKFLHHRQPVMFNREQALQWVDSTTPGEALDALCKSQLPQDLTVKPVSEYVNNARHKGAECLEVIGDEIQLSATV